MAQAGPSPLLIPGIGPMLVMAFSKYRVVVVTDRAVVLLRASKLVPSKIKHFDERLPRSTRVSPNRGMLWGKVEIGGQRHYVHRRFYQDCANADARPVTTG